ncbi:hypothetical protein GCM10022629_65770 [Amorphoplanes auranticolor]
MEHDGQDVVVSGEPQQADADRPFLGEVEGRGGLDGEQRLGGGLGSRAGGEFRQVLSGDDRRRGRVDDLDGLGAGEGVTRAQDLVPFDDPGPGPAQRRRVERSA